jgi:hypothetical protein
VYALYRPAPNACPGYRNLQKDNLSYFRAFFHVQLLRCIAVHASTIHIGGKLCIWGVGVVGAAKVCCGIRYGADFHHNGTEVDCNK